MKLNNALSLLFSSLALVACSQGQFGLNSAIGDAPARQTIRSAGEGIIGGVLVSSADPIASWTGMLIDVSRGSLCTVSILSDQWLMTAAHCVADANANSLLVSFTGTFQELVAGQNRADMRRVAQVEVHPSYANTMQKINAMFEAAKAEGREVTIPEIDAVTDWADIALLRIDGSIPSTKQPATFLPNGFTLRRNQSVILAGYGRTGPNKDAPSGELHKVDVLVEAPVRGQTEVLVNNMWKGACHGDSGGPAYVFSGGRYYLFGVTSHGVGDGGACDHFTAYTNAVYYRPWIQNVIGAPQSQPQSRPHSSWWW